jgi:4-hydroxy-2-oxoheptanedioate aldolase
MLPRIEVVELLSAAGFAAVLIDLEHGPISHVDLPALAAAARGSGIYAVARLADASAVSIGHALDAGVDGIMVPHVGSAADAERVVSWGRFGPVGQRSIQPFTRGNSYGLGTNASVEEVNDRVALIVMLEGRDVMSSLDAICQVPELDAVFIGPVDLSASLGLAGESDHPSVAAAVADALARIKAMDCASGVYASTSEAGARWFAQGSSLVAVSADTALALRAFRDASAAVGSALALTQRASPVVMAEG